MVKGGWIVKFDDVEVERCYAISFDYDNWEYTVNNQETKKFPASQWDFIYKDRDRRRLN